MSYECPGCAEVDVQWEDYNGQQICTECGYVLSYTTLTGGEEGIQCYEDRSAFEGLPKSFVQRNAKTDSRSKIQGAIKTRQIARALKLSAGKAEECSSLFEKIYESKKIETRNSKVIIGGCVCYIMCRLLGWPVSTTEVSLLTGCSLQEFVALLKKVEQILPAQYKVLPQDITELVLSWCSGADLEELSKDTVKLIQLCKEAWIVDGRKYSSVVKAAAYVVWQAKNYLERKKVTLLAFCKAHNLKCEDACRSRVKEIQEVLCKLAKEIPWVVSDCQVSNKTVALYLGDILKYQQSLIMDAAMKIRQNNQSHEKCEEIPSEVQISTSRENASKDEKKCALLTSPATKRTSVSCFLPPAFKKARKQHKPDEEYPENCFTLEDIKGLESPELNEENTFPDSELSRYIRSPREVEMLKKVDNYPNC